MTPLDICYQCIAAVASNATRSKVYDAKNFVATEGGQFAGYATNAVSVPLALQLMAGTAVIKDYDGYQLPMVAMTTVDGNRVCAIHIYRRRGVLGDPGA